MVKLSRIAPELPVADLDDPSSITSKNLDSRLRPRCPLRITRSLDVTTLRSICLTMTAAVPHLLEFTSSPKTSTCSTLNFRNAVLASCRGHTQALGESGLPCERRLRKRD